MIPESFESLPKILVPRDMPIGIPLRFVQKVTELLPKLPPRGMLGARVVAIH